MSKRQDGMLAGFTAAERDFIRRELDMFFSTLPRVSDGFQRSAEQLGNADGIACVAAPLRCARPGTWRELLAFRSARGGRQRAGGPMSFEIYIPSHTDDWGEQQPERVIGTGESEEAAWRTVRRHLCFTAQIHLIARCHVREIAPPTAPPVFAESETAYGISVKLPRSNGGD
jgi:hypothetical protein